LRHDVDLGAIPEEEHLPASEATDEGNAAILIDGHLLNSGEQSARQRRADGGDRPGLQISRRDHQEPFNAAGIAEEGGFAPTVHRQQAMAINSRCL